MQRSDRARPAFAIRQSAIRQGAAPRPRPARLARPALAAALLLAALLAGCADSKAPASGGEEAAAEAQGMRIEGIVQSLGFEPIAGATVAIQDLNMTETTGPDGRFAFPPVEEALHTVEAVADGFQPATLLAQPTGGLVGLDFQLTPVVIEQPRNVTVQYKGTLQCAMEAFILSPSCDSALVFLNDKSEENGGGRPAPEPFTQNATFPFVVEPGWTTLVLDLAFDPEASPGLDGMRITLRGLSDEGEAGTYEALGQFWGPDPFSARVEPNGTYDGGDRPVPPGAAAFRAEIFPQSHFWHEACTPPDSETCFLGVGAGLDVEFQLIVTAFYVEPAPEGWTLLDGA